MIAVRSWWPKLVVALALYAGAIGVALARMGLLEEARGVRLSSDWAMTDFYSAAYYPARALLEGENPHNRDRYLSRYPVTDTYPPYLPVNLLVHLPFTLLAPAAAGAAYFAFTALLTLALAYAALRISRLSATGPWIVGIAGAVLLSRPGHWTLLLGQAAILLALLTYVALGAGRSAPAVSGAALAVAIMKPTFGIPLALLMWAWGRRRAAILGLGAAVIVNAPLVAVLAAREGGLGRFLSVLLSGYQAWQDISDVQPATSATRIDATSLVSRLLGSPLPDTGQALLAAVLLGLAAIVLYRLSRHENGTPLDVPVGLICITMMLIGFHRGYDLVLLTAPFVAAAVRGLPGTAAPALRWLVLVLFVVPAMNWLATESVLDAWQPERPVWLLITSATSVCLVGLYLVYVWLGLVPRATAANGGYRGRSPPRATAAATLMTWVNVPLALPGTPSTLGGTVRLPVLPPRSSESFAPAAHHRQ